MYTKISDQLKAHLIKPVTIKLIEAYLGSNELQFKLYLTL